MSDRNDFLQNIWPKKPSEGEHRNHPFRQMFLDKMDTEITKVVLHFFQAVETRWPDSWSDLDRRGNVLPKTNGLKALMRFLKPVYLQLAGSDRHYVPSSDEFLRIVKGVQLRDDDFNITTFPPGTSGESRLFKILQNSIEAPEGQQTEIF